MKSIIVAAASAAVLAVPAAAQAASTTHQIRDADLVTVPGVADGNGGNGTHEFLADGLRINVPDSTDSYVVLRWAAGVPLSQVTSVDYDWTGTDSRPGVKYDIDGDGDGTIDCELIGEQAYGGEYVWLNKDSSDFIGSKAASDYCETKAPESSDNGPTHTGYDYDGTLADWSASLGSKATIVDVGIGASGLVQQGVLSSVDLGSNHYTFTNQPATQVAGPSVVDVTGSRSVHQTRHAIGFTFSSEAQRAGTTTGRDLTWTVLVNGHRRFSVTQGPGQQASYAFVNHNRSHRKVVRLYRNGVAVGRYVVGKA